MNKENPGPAAAAGLTPKRSRHSANNAAGAAAIESDEKVSDEAQRSDYEAAGRRVWVDARDEHGIWWPAELVSGLVDEHVRVRLALGDGHGRELDVDPTTAVFVAGTFAYYGQNETILKPSQAVLFDLRRPSRAAASSVPAGGAHEWVVATVESINSTGVATVRLLEDKGATHNVFQGGNRLRSLGPTNLQRIHKIPVQLSIQRAASLAAGGSGRVSDAAGAAPPSPVGYQRAPTHDVSSRILQERWAESKQGQSRPAGEYHQRRVARRIVAAGSSQYDHFRHSLHESQMSLHECIGDGNCLYRSVAHQVYGDQSLHWIVREAAFAHMRAHADMFAPFCSALMEDHLAHVLQRANDPRPVSEVYSDAEMFEMYIDMYSRDSVWGGDPEISAMCRVYRRTAHIFVYDHARGHRVEVRDVVPGAPPMLLSYYGGGHYDSIVDRTFEQRLLRKEPGVHEAECLTRYENRRQHDGNLNAGDGAPQEQQQQPDSSGYGGNGGSKSDDDDHKGSSYNPTANSTLGKKDRNVKRAAYVKLLGTDDLNGTDDEKLLKEMEDANVQAVLNVTSVQDDKDKLPDAHVSNNNVGASDEFVEVQQMIMQQVAQDQLREQREQERLLREQQQQLQAAIAPGVSEEDQIALAIALSAMENPILAAVEDDRSQNASGVGPADDFNAPPQPELAASHSGAPNVPPPDQSAGRARSLHDEAIIAQMRQQYGNVLPDEELLSIAQAMGGPSPP